MEGWLNFRDGSAFHEVVTLQDSKGKKGSSFYHDFSLVECGFDESKNRLRGLFNEVLVTFLRENTVEKCIRPLPVLCANGRPVDLFKLFWVVRKLGGYDPISRKKLWGFVAEECGLGFGAIASLKLIYRKYLNELDHWLWQGFRDSSFLDSGDRVVKKLELMLQDLEFGDLMDVSLKQGEDVKLVELEFDKTRNAIDSGKILLRCLSGGNINEAHHCRERYFGKDDKTFNSDNDNDLVLSSKQVIEEVDGFSKRKTCDNDNKTCFQNKNGSIVSSKKVIEKAISNVHDSTVNTTDIDKDGVSDENSGNVMLSAKSVVDKVIDSRKRKRESSSWSEMLIWLINTAKHSDDLKIGRVPECAKWKSHRNDELWSQALLAREALLIRRHVNLNAESSVLQQKKFRMHPSMYEEDAVNHQFGEKSRCSQRLPLAKSHLCSCCNSASQSKGANPQNAEAGYSSNESPLVNVEGSAIDNTDYDSLDEPSEKKVSVGPLFQAEVPEWTGVVVESDAKWQGKRMWPPEDELVASFDPIGKGRPNTCDCSFPGKTECIRFHIAEKRFKLKLESGGLFYRWRFDHTGEEVSLSWTIEEEKKFKDMIRLNNESTNKFWSNAFRLFPSKTREKLVSYYFNVFLIRRRSYQNWVTPKDVDSDDDEKEFGSVGDSFGYKAIYVPESRLPICSENKQCADLE